MSLIGCVDHLYMRQVFTCRDVLESGLNWAAAYRCGPILARLRNGIFVPAAEDAGPRNVTCDDGLLNIGDY